MTAMFATPDDVATAMGVTQLTDTQQAQITALIQMATDEIRTTARAWIAPTRTATVRLAPRFGGTVDLPQTLVQSVDAVTTAQGTPAGFSWDGARLHVAHEGPVLVTYTYGAATVPPSVKRMTIALVAEAIALTEFSIMQVGRIRTLAIDDFRVAFSDEGIGGGVTIPTLQARELRARYGPAETGIIHMRDD